jgi:membrane protease YdiL (CAAX protease family)
MSALAAVALLVAGGTVAWLIPGEKTPFEQMLESSAAARFATAFLATATAPLVEELVYRGVLYPALRRVTGVVWAVVIVSAMFSVVHVTQYYNNIGVIAAVSMLAFALTYVRARTGRVLPCFVIHLIFNGLQVAALIFEYFFPGKLSGDAKTGLLALIHYPFTFF